jgi:hypothetical protein
MNRSPGTYAAIAFGLVGAYLLSPPFVAWVLLRLGMVDHPIITYLYAPAFLLYQNFRPYKTMIDGMFVALGVS